MALAKSTPTQIGSITALANGASYTSNIFDVSDAIAAEIELILSYSTAPSSGGISVAILPSQDGTNLADEAIVVGAAYPSGTSWRYILPVNVIGEKYIAVKITNNTDQSVDATINIIKTIV